VIERNGVPRNAFDVVSNPEFLREGTAVEDFLHPDRIVVGSDTPRAAELLSAIYAPLTDGSYYEKADFIAGCCSKAAPPVLLHTSTKSAEIIKHASNAFLALKISFINAVSNLCEAADANVEQVARGIGLDSRIGPKFLRPGIGYGGSCFPKDVAAFRSVAEQMGVDFNLLSEVEKINVNQKKRFLSKVRSALWTLRGKRLAVLGLSFKGDTDDIRESPAIDLVEMLLAEGCSVVAYDPAAMKRAAAELPPSAQMRYADSAAEAARDADALLILTDWAEFGGIDLEMLHATMRYPIVIDGRNLYDPHAMMDHGFTYLSIGRPAATPSREPSTVGA
jgi:UDPglucose 6-dehydrogenase